MWLFFIVVSNVPLVVLCQFNQSSLSLLAMGISILIVLTKNCSLNHPLWYRLLCVQIQHCTFRLVNYTNVISKFLPRDVAKNKKQKTKNKKKNKKK